MLRDESGRGSSRPGRTLRRARAPWPAGAHAARTFRARADIRRLRYALFVHIRLVLRTWSPPAPRPGLPGLPAWGTREMLAAKDDALRRGTLRTPTWGPTPRTFFLICALTSPSPPAACRALAGRVLHGAWSGWPPATMSRRTVYRTAFARRPRLRLPTSLLFPPQPLRNSIRSINTSVEHPALSCPLPAVIILAGRCAGACTAPRYRGLSAFRFRRGACYQKASSLLPCTVHSE